MEISSKDTSEALYQKSERPKKRSAPRRSAVNRAPDQGPSAEPAFVEQLKERQSEWDFEEQARRNPTLLVRRTLRSGQHVRFDGHVVVLGDVNPGAEIRASGDIVVMGWLRGLAHAGAEGDDAAKVSAFRLDPTQLRIGPYIGRAPDHGESVLPDIPEIAEVRDGHLVIDRWRASVLTTMAEQLGL